MDKLIKLKRRKEKLDNQINSILEEISSINKSDKRYSQLTTKCRQLNDEYHEIDLEIRVKGLVN